MSSPNQSSEAPSPMQSAISDLAKQTPTSRWPSRLRCTKISDGVRLDHYRIADFYDVDQEVIGLFGGTELQMGVTKAPTTKWVAINGDENGHPEKRDEGKHARRSSDGAGQS